MPPLSYTTREPALRGTDPTAEPRRALRTP